MALRHVHVVGAGLAGLSAAVTLAQAGVRATLYEAGPAAGGRCRSYFDKALGVRIDNGNHLLLSGNDATMAYLSAVGARESLTGPGRPVFAFMDVGSGERWTVAPGRGRIPWWILTRRIPGTRLADYLGLRRLQRAGADETVAALVGGTELYRRLIEPLSVSALNTPCETASAALLWAVLEGSLMRGGAACVPLWPREGMSETLVDPALAWLAARGGLLRTGCRVSGIDIENGRVRGFHLPDGPVALAADEALVLAVSAPVACDLLPGLAAPTAFEAIVNLHFRVGEAEVVPDLGAGIPGFMGLIGGTAEWLFAKPGVVSVTISAANRLAETPNAEIVARVWQDIQTALGWQGPMPPVRVLREKRATFAATPACAAMRSLPLTGIACMAVAGDWTATGLPSTIEGAIRSGRSASLNLLAQA